MIKELKELLKKEAEQQGKDFELERASTLSDLGYNFKDAIKKLKEAGIPVVLTEEEKEQMIKNIREGECIRQEGHDIFSQWYGKKPQVNIKPISSLEDIIACHKTDFAPKGEKIHSRHSGKVLHNCNVTLGGKEYSYTCESGRNTVHCSANHEVSPNDGGNWSKKKYAVLIPFPVLNEKSKIKSAKAVDIYTEGPIQLNEECYILCPKGEGETVRNENPNVTVIEYEGEVVQDYANVLISALGYKLELGDDHGFRDREAGNSYCDIMKKAGFTVQPHFYSEDKDNEQNLGIVYQLVGLMKLIKDEKILEKIERKKLIEELNGQHFSEMINMVFGPNEKYSDTLVEELKKIGIEISIDGMREAVEEHVDENRRLHKDYDTIVTDYMLKSIANSERKFSTKEIGAATEGVEKKIQKNVKDVEAASASEISGEGKDTK